MKIRLKLCLLLCMPMGVVSGDDLAPLMQEGGGIIKAFFGDLKTELVDGIKAGGPVHAIGVCNKIAPSLAESHSDTSGWEVGRTSLKVRNPSNRPDDWEQQVLQRFEARKAAGEDPSQLVHAEIIANGNGREFRMMKAIPTAEVCTRCHGTQIEAPVEAKLDELYPQDRARGYRPGDLRGAFTLRKKL